MPKFKRREDPRCDAIGKVHRAHKTPRDLNGKRRSPMSVLSKPMQDVVENYLRGMTKIQAMERAGYAATTARKAAWRIFGREDVQRAIEYRQANRRHRTNMMMDRVQEELARIAFFNIGKVLEITEDGQLVFNFEDATLEEFAAIGEVTVETFVSEGAEVKRVKIKPLDKKAALDSLARIHGMFQDNMNVTSDGASIEERLNRGRERLRQKNTLEGEFEEVGGDA